MSSLTSAGFLMYLSVTFYPNICYCNYSLWLAWMCDECAWHHTTFLVQLCWRYALHYDASSWCFTADNMSILTCPTLLYIILMIHSWQDAYTYMSYIMIHNPDASQLTRYLYLHAIHYDTSSYCFTTDKKSIVTCHTLWYIILMLHSWQEVCTYIPYIMIHHPDAS